MSKKDKKKIDFESEGMHFTGDYTMPSTSESMRGHVGNAMSIVSDIIEPFVPLFGTVEKVMESLYTIYENAKCNKKMCGALIDRIEVVEQATKSLQRKKQENAAKFRSEEYYLAWVRFTNVLKNIKVFAKDVTQQSVFQKHLNANAVKEAYDKNINEFEAVCKDLQFSVYMISEEQRKEENDQITNELNLLGWAMNEVSDEVKNISKQINILSEQLNSQKLNSGEIKVLTVDDSELTDPEITNPDNVRGSEKTIVKRIYRGTLQVACKKVKAIDKNESAGSRNVQTQLVILGLLGICPNIITFYGLAKIGQDDYMIFDWAEHGSLKEVYEKCDMSIHTKLRFIYNIFKGLSFIFNSGVLHHDVRCENILVTENPDVKITNFEMSREIKAETTSFSGLNDYVRWLAPEKMLWELINEKVPYKDKSFKEIQELVKSKKREELPSQLNSNPILLELTKLIKQKLRLSYPEILKLLSTLVNRMSLSSPRISPKNDSSDVTDFELDNKRSFSLSSSSHYEIDPEKLPDVDDCVLDDVPTFSIVKPFEDGVKAHREKRYKEAWECFDEHAKLGLSLAKYWKGFYLEKGYHGEKDVMEGLKWLKYAADDGLPDAQLRYASGLINLSKSTGSSENYKTILEYMKKAADGGSETALYNLGDIYFNGKLGAEKDEKKGNEFFDLAALKNPKFMKKHPTQSTQ
ncbi:10220_t:CDS:2 [Diversispora eburnea]|uniref:10220_t:CDS:1 n=1 Tax=Diversispora eburnea TaxID=1213867 RepID=A0A9N8W0J5_9GLOM|nr:10220_t:CDS:2 [Diversispora eburnea]